MTPERFIKCKQCEHVFSEKAFEEYVCEHCGVDQGELDHWDDCDECEQITWWMPKCPKCGSASEWQYD